MEVAGIKAQRQTWSEADVYKLKNAVKRAQGTDDAGVNWASVSTALKLPRGGVTDTRLK